MSATPSPSPSFNASRHPLGRVMHDYRQRAAQQAALLSEAWHLREAARLLKLADPVKTNAVAAVSDLAQRRESSLGTAETALLAAWLGAGQAGPAPRNDDPGAMLGWLMLENLPGVFPYTHGAVALTQTALTPGLSPLPAHDPPALALALDGGLQRLQAGLRAGQRPAAVVAELVFDLPDAPEWRCAARRVWALALNRCLGVAPEACAMHHLARAGGAEAPGTAVDPRAIDQAETALLVQIATLADTMMA